MSEAEIRRSISKFNQYISERNRFVLGDEDYIARGYKPVLVMNEGYADVSYEETPELIEAQKQAAINKRLQLINLPSTLKEASLAKVDLDDRGRFGDLERHFATSRNGDETWQAKRVMERIKFLAKEVRLEGENRR